MTMKPAGMRSGLLAAGLGLLLTGCNHASLLGINPDSCSDPQGRPPVLLIHGTFSSPAIAFSGLAPHLVEEGRCVYAATYGGEPGDLIHGMGRLSDSEQQLDAWIRTIQKRTGAPKVDVVGHSQGGLLALVLAKRGESARGIRRVVALAPSTRGSVKADETSPPVGEGQRSAWGWNCPACSDQRTDSPYIREVGGLPPRSRGPRAVIFASSADEVVGPPEAQFLQESWVRNEVLQAHAPEAWLGHVSMLYEPAVWRLVSQALEGEFDPQI